MKTIPFKGIAVALFIFILGLGDAGATLVWISVNGWSCSCGLTERGGTYKGYATSGNDTVIIKCKNSSDKCWEIDGVFLRGFDGVAVETHDTESEIAGTSVTGPFEME